MVNAIKRIFARPFKNVFRVWGQRKCVKPECGGKSMCKLEKQKRRLCGKEREENKVSVCGEMICTLCLLAFGAGKYKGKRRLPLSHHQMATYAKLARIRYRKRRQPKNHTMFEVTTTVAKGSGNKIKGDVCKGPHSHL